MPKIVMDGQEIEVAPGTTILQAALSIGREIPHYCYHPGLPVAGNCRMCLVEVEKAPKLVIACYQPVSDGMVVRTQSDKVRKARAAMMEFFLIHHPLDCPICDQAGECRLQEYAVEHGTGRSRYTEPKRALAKAVDVGAHVMLDQERCIQCSRCIRFCDEVTRTGELGFFQRGDRTVIGIYPGKRLDNPYSGNVVDLCPVGALTLKEFRFETRVWYLRNTPSVCAACARGCNVMVATGTQNLLMTTRGQQDDRIRRVVPRVNEEVNGWWICDEGRLAFLEMQKGERLETAEMPRGTPADWDAAIAAAAAALREAAAAGRAGAILSPRLVTEDLYAWRELFARLGSVRAGVRRIARGRDDDLLIRGLDPRGAGDRGCRPRGRRERAARHAARRRGPALPLRHGGAPSRAGGEGAADRLRGPVRRGSGLRGRHPPPGGRLVRGRRDLRELPGPPPARPPRPGPARRGEARLEDRARPRRGGRRRHAALDRGGSRARGDRAGGARLRGRGPEGGRPARCSARGRRPGRGVGRRGPVSDHAFQVAATLAKILVVVGVLLGGVSAMTWVERRVSGLMQFRWGPNRVGPFGLFQPIADGLKFMLKQDVVPAEAHKPTYTLAPALSLVPALCAFAVIPFGPNVEVLGRKTSLVIADLDGGVLFALAAASLGVYGVVMAGWSSRSRYSLLGGLRSSAQMISYELALGLSVAAAVLVSGTLRPVEIVEQQAGWFVNWNAFAGGWQLLGFVVFLVAGFAETNRLPFDLPEAEGELVAGYHTEYSAMKFAMFFMAEYVNMITSSALAVTLFLGGWQLGVPVGEGLAGWPLWTLQIAAFAGKVAFFQFLFVWVRWTLPRFRYDQLMNLGWKGLFPIALANVLVTALLVAFDVVR